MKFTEDMIGKRVKEITTGDAGVITRQCQLNSNHIYVLWDKDNLELWIALDKVTFICETLEEITIGGIRYKLTRIED